MSDVNQPADLPLPDNAMLHELVWVDRAARPAIWKPRCGRADVPLERAISSSPDLYYQVTCRDCLRAQGAAAERERIRQLAIAEGTRNVYAIASGALYDFADLLAGDAP